jgi:hypothetical protein
MAVKKNVEALLKFEVLSTITVEVAKTIMATTLEDALSLGRDDIWSDLIGQLEGVHVNDANIVLTGVFSA